MRILVIQLSDIHISLGENSFLSKKDNLFNVVKNSTKEFDHVLLIISGDSAFSGQKEEYTIIENVIRELSEKIEAYAGKKVQTILIPGNHDCDFDKDNKTRKNNINSIQRLGDAVIDESVIEQCSSIQDEYFAYRERLHDTTKVVFTSRLITQYRYELSDKVLYFNCYNSAYLSELKEQPGKLHLPLSLLPPSISTIEADLIVSLFHHPFNWYNPINKREFQTHIHKTSDFYLTGHEHAFSSSSVDDLEGNIVYHIEGSVLQDSEDAFLSEFNLIAFDLNKAEFKIKKLLWNNDHYELSSRPSEWLSYKRGKAKLRGKYILNKDFENFISDIGGQFKHPHKSDITLSDLYVYPKLRFFNSIDRENEQKASYLFEDAESVVDNIKSKIIFFGEENVGKTSLLKITYKKLHATGQVPIYIDGSTVRSASFEDFKKVVAKHFQEQYQDVSVEDFENEDLKKVFILIDDFNRNPIKNQKARGKLIKAIGSYYENLILVGNELIAVEEIISDELTKGDLYSSFKQYEVIEFNHSKKYELVYKWYSLGQEDILEDNEILRKCDNAIKAIETAMGQKIVPNFPIFLLILLQTIETSNPHDLNISSYGNYYQFLILKSLTEAIKDQADLTLYQNYSCELANYFFEKKTRIISVERDFIPFHNRITNFENLDLPLLSWEKALKTLVSVGVLDEWNDDVQFKYSYTYYYFQSQYLSKNIRKEAVKKTITELCDRLYRTEAANIIMFLIQFSNDEFILDELIKNSKKVFSEFEPCKLENDIDQLQNLVTELPKLYLKNKSADEVRKEENAERDQNEENKEEDNEEAEAGEDTEITMISKLNLSFKLLEIIGQILKNNHGVIGGPVKHQMLLETYSLGLRTLHFFFDLFNNNTDFILHQFKEMVSKKHSDEDDDKLEKIARNILFSLCSQISFLFIRKVSDSMGSSKLMDKYGRIQEELDFASVKLINFLIKLDHSSGFPDKDLSILKSQIEKHPLSYYVLKRIVINHLHRNVLNYKDKQRICTFLGIPLESQLKIEATMKTN
jgi:hypothetical protein